jgi:hypothetical protein
MQKPSKQNDGSRPSLGIEALPELCTTDAQAETFGKLGGNDLFFNLMDSIAIAAVKEAMFLKRPRSGLFNDYRPGGQ